VLDGVSMSVEADELLAIAGRSGSGKSTVLRMIAGLEKPTGGTITIGDRDVTRLPPQERDIAMVFQSYALFPHLRVFDNVAFGLRRAGVEQPLQSLPATPGVPLRYCRCDGSRTPGINQGCQDPDDAAELGLTDHAAIKGPGGDLVAPIELEPGMRRGVVSLPHGWGHDRRGTRQGVATDRPGVNVNQLNDGGQLDPLSGTAVLNGIPVDIAPAG